MLTEELVRRGHAVTLFATGDSRRLALGSPSNGSGAVVPGQARSWPTMPWLLDGLDIPDTGETGAEVRAYQLRICGVCGTVRDTRFPFCCELAAFAPSPPQERTAGLSAAARPAAGSAQ